MSLKDTVFTKILTVRNIFVAGNFLLLGLFVGVVVKDALREWRPYEKEYLNREVKHLHEALASAKTPEEKESAERALKAMSAQPVKIRQVMLPAMNRYDRCLTCHTGMDS